MTDPKTVLDRIKLKHRREDFCVTEAVALEPPLPQDGAGSSYTYCRLKKSGLTTFQAIELTAAFLNLPPAQVTYCGLKDEDGITDQMIALPGNVDIGRQDRRVFSDDTSQVEIVPYGTYRLPLEIGGLVGNAFRICIRNLPVTLRGRLENLPRSDPAWFINYYDTQRFGVPGGPKTTHRIGAALLERDFTTAIDLLKRAATPEAERALAWQGDAEAFFATLEPRLIAFFLSADSSFHWNAKVQNELAAALDPKAIIRYARDGLEFLAARSAGDLQTALSAMPAADYRRYRVQAGQHSFTAVSRPTLVQTTIRVEDVGEDEDHAGSLKMAVSFFLPSGCYATNVVNQWVLSLSNA